MYGGIRPRPLNWPLAALHGCTGSETPALPRRVISCSYAKLRPPSFTCSVTFEFRADSGSLSSLAHISAISRVETGRDWGSAALSPVSHYRHAKSFLRPQSDAGCTSASAWVHLVYLMLQIFPHALVFTPNTNLSIHLFFFSSPSLALLSPGSAAPLSLSASSSPLET